MVRTLGARKTCVILLGGLTGCMAAVDGPPEQELSGTEQALLTTTRDIAEGGTLGAVDPDGLGVSEHEFENVQVEPYVDICTPGCDAEYSDDWDRCGVWMEPSRNQCRWAAYWEWVACNDDCMVNSGR